MNQVLINVKSWITTKVKSIYLSYLAHIHNVVFLWQKLLLLIFEIHIKIYIMTIFLDSKKE